jgi:hypothetical protein
MWIISRIRYFTDTIEMTAMRLKLLLCAALCIVPGLFVMHGQAQNVNGVLIDATNTVTRNPSAAFEINANTNTPDSPVYGGLLIPQVALSGTNDATTISGAEADGLLVFNTNDGGGVTKGYYYWNTGTNSWVRVLSTTSGITGVADPTATIGLTAVNGTATTALRSDGAPALSQAIVSQDGIGIAVHLFAEVLIEDEAKDVVAEIVRAHLAPQGIGNVPEFGLKVFAHGVF